VGLGTTLNAGNYQSIKIDIAVEDDSREGESAEQAFNRVYAFVDKQLERKVEQTQREIAEAGL